jgi:hypothetical protein
MLARGDGRASSRCPARLKVAVIYKSGWTGSLGGTKVEREVVVDAQHYIIECALAEDGSSPAKDFLDTLEDGMWIKDPNEDDFPSDEQIYDYPKLMYIFEHFAKHGEPPHANCINFLEKGVWEFKFSDKRVSYFDTPGNGTFTPKNKVRTRADSEYASHDFWWLPDFDPYVRLGHSFGKTGEKTDPRDIDRALATREEDLAHDTEN